MRKYLVLTGAVVLAAAASAMAVDDYIPVMPNGAGGEPVEASGDPLWDTGPPRTVLFDPAGGGDYVETFLGFSSGNLNPNFPDRRAAMPFTLGDPGEGLHWRIKQIDVDYFIPAGFEFTDLNFRVYARTGEVAPTAGDIVYEETLSAPPGLDDPEVEGADEFLHQLFTDFKLDAGDYYLSIYGLNAAGEVSNAAWLTNADNGLPFVNDAGPWMWRQATEGAGFQFYQLSELILKQVEGLDPEDLYRQSFTLYGEAIPEPVTVSLLALGGLVALRRRR